MSLVNGLRIFVGTIFDWRKNNKNLFRFDFINKIRFTLI